MDKNVQDERVWSRYSQIVLQFQDEKLGKFCSSESSERKVFIGRK